MNVPRVPAIEFNRRLYGLAVVCRFVQGLVSFAVLLAAFGPNLASATAAQRLVSLRLVASAILCGMGLGIPLDRWLSQTWSRRPACILTATCSTVGLGLAWQTRSIEVLQLAGLIVGLGVASDWSSIGELARRSLPIRHRWPGMRIWTTAFAAGVACAVLLAGLLTTTLIVSLALVAVLTALMIAVKPLNDSAQHQHSVEPAPAPPPEPEKLEPSASKLSATNDSTTPQPSDCDATECCGGGLRALRPTGFWHGVLLATVGCLCWFGPMAHIAALLSETSDKSAWAFSFALPLGYLLMISTAPRTGYVIVLLPCLLFSGLSTVALSVISLDSQWLPLFAFSTGLCSAASVCGISALIGELFTDGATDGQRSRILCVAAFASTVVLLLLATLHLLTSSESSVLAWQSSIFALGIAVVRRLPDPTVSSVGINDPSDQADEEFHSVMASLSLQNQSSPESSESPERR